MALKRRYSGKLLILDIILALITSGMWLFVVVIRELYRMNKYR